LRRQPFQQVRRGEQVTMLLGETAERIIDRFQADLVSTNTPRRRSMPSAFTGGMFKASVL
jgi:hypothetical protein